MAFYRIYLSFLIFAFICILLFPASLQAGGESNIQWMELESAHFIIHYPISREAFARRALSIAEEAYERLVPILESPPSEKTNITIIDALDQANGSARDVPEAQMKLYAYPPKPDSELGDYDDWMRQLIYHEYTHILNAEYAHSFYKFFDYIFGKFARPNILSPVWFKEGLAVYYETQMSGSGRLRNAIYDTIVRNAVFADTVPTLDSISTGLVSWPGGGAQYIFGSSFIEYIADTYGKDSLTHWNHVYGDSFPLFLNRIARKVWNKSWDDLYDEWRDILSGKAMADLAAAGVQGKLTPHRTLTGAHRHRRPQAIPGSRDISYVRDNGYLHTGIVRLDPLTGKEDEIVQCWGDCEHHWSDDGTKLYFVHAAYERGFRYINRLYVYDTQTDKENIVEIPGSIRSFAIDGSMLYWIAQNDDTCELYRMKLTEGENYQWLYKSRPFEQIESIIARRNMIAASVFDLDKRQFDLEIMHISENASGNGLHIDRRKLTDSKSPDLNPSFCFDSSICYVSAKTGQMNLWKVSTNGGSSIRLTHLIDGILDPVQSRDGGFYYTQYTAHGTAIAAIRLDDLRSYNDTADIRSPAPSYDPLHNAAIAPAKPNRSWEWMFPKQWQPRFSYSETFGSTFGISISGSDEIDHHKYSLIFDYHTGKNSFDLDFNYLWKISLYNINLSLNIAQNTASWFSGQRIQSFDYQTLSSQLSFISVLNQRLSTHFLTARFKLQLNSSEESLSWSREDPTGDIPRLPSLGWNNALIFNWVWTSIQQTELSFVPNTGFLIDMQLLFEMPWIGADCYSLIWSLSFFSSWTMPYLYSHTLSNKVKVAVSTSQDKDRMPFSVSSNEGFVFNITGEDSALHGYPTGIVYGKNYFYMNTAYTMVLWEPSFSYSTAMIGLERIGSDIFFDAANAWNEEFDFFKTKFDIGMKLHFDLVLAYSLPIRVSIGYAWGGSLHGGHEVFFFIKPL